MVNSFYNGYFLYSEPQKNLKDWSDEVFNDNFRILLSKEMRKITEGTGDRTKDGLIPDIELDLKMPRGLTYILGEGGRLTVDGFQEINLEVKQNNQTYGQYGSYSSFPQIILKERLKAKINGTIGEKLHVNIDHDSDMPEQDNLMKIWYGSGSSRTSDTEDDIIQELHLGRISEIGSEKLFGIATRGKIGSTSFDLSAGKLESDEVSGSAAINISSKVDSIYEKDFLRNEYFHTGLPHPSDSLLAYGLFIDYTGQVPPYNLLKFNGDTIGDVFFLELVEGEDYELGQFLQEGKSPLPYFHILKPHRISNRRLGVYLIFADSTGKIDTLGDLTGAKHTLYQLKSTNPDPGDPSWNYLMRNIYYLGNWEPSNVDVEIYKIVAGGNNSQTNSKGEEYTEILGITTGEGNIISSQILWKNGHLVFPDRFPFLNPGLDADTVPEIYRQKTLYEDDGKHYYIVIKTTSSMPESFRLKSSGEIIKDSEKLTMEGRTLQRNIDYTIDYLTGEVKFLKKEKLPPDAKITYEFKSKPFFSFDSKYKTHFNIKAIPIEDSRLNLDLGFLSRSNKGIYHPTVGHEPSNITLGKVDFSLNKEPEFLSNLFANLPFVDGESKSGFNIDASYGFSKPNPATNGKSYLDNMEFIEQAVGVGLADISSWHYCSQPDNSIRVDRLAKLDWFVNANYSKSKIFSEYATTSYTENKIAVMVLYFQPENTSNWGGIMRALNSEYDFSQKNFLEIWVKAEEGEIIFEMGNKIDEDQIRWGKSSIGADSIIAPNGKWDTEDKNMDGDLQQKEEDTGLDGIKMNDSDWVYDTDNYDYGIDDCVPLPKTFADSLKTHNKEGNQRLDSEDLNGDYTFNRENSFFRYKIDLSSPDYLSKEGLNGWKVYALPLKDSSAFEKIGNPSFESIEYTRLWLRGMNGNTRIILGKIDIVGNKWRDKGVRLVSNNSRNSSGGSFEVGFRNTREDKDYINPVELIREPGSYTYQKEQSISLQIDSLLTDNYCLIENYLELPLPGSGRGYDFRLYKELNLYTTLFKENTSDSAEVFIRLLTDSLNYYQFNTFAYKDNWDTIQVFFDSLTNLKIDNDTLQGKYSLKGNPSLQSIAFLHLGVANKTSETFRGEVLIDDIILKGADNRLGSNIDLSISTNVGDLITGLSYNTSRKSANYKSNLDALRELGDREVVSQGFMITTDAGKFLNKAISFPISYNVRESFGTPIYRTNSDVILPLEESESLTDQNYSQNITASLSRPSTSDNWFLKHTVDNLKFSGSYRKSEIFIPMKNTDTTISMTGSVNYSLRLPKLPSPFLSGQSSSLLPSDIGLNTSYEYSESEKYNYKDTLYEKIDEPLKKELTSYATLSYEPIRWVNVDYALTTKNDLRERESSSGNSSFFDLGQDASLHEEISVTHRSNQLGINTLNITYRTSFVQNHEIEYARILGDSLDVRRCSQQRTIRLSNDLKLNSILEKVPLVSRLSRNISPLKFSAYFSKDGTFAYLNSIPGYRFRYGIETSPESSLFEQIEKTDGGYFDKSYSLSSGLSFSKLNLRVNWKFSQKKPDELQLKNTQTPKETIQLTFPDINVDLPDMHKYIPFLGNYVRRASFSVSVSSDSSYTKSLGEKIFSSGDYSFNISPNFNMDFKNDLGVKVTYQYNSRKIYPDSKLNTRTKTNGLRINFNYTLKPSASGFPLLFLTRIKFDKPVYLNASVSYKDNMSYRTDVYGEEAISDNTRTIDFSLNGNYDFSNMVSGSLTINFSNHLNRRLDVSSVTYGGAFNVKLNF